MGGLEFNANTIRGRSNVAMATIGTISAGALYFKLFGGKKVRRLERRDWPIVKYLTFGGLTLLSFRCPFIEILCA